MRQFIIIAGLIIGVFSLAFVSQADEKQNSKDKYIFERLLRERLEIYEKYTASLRKGKDQLKNKGDVDLNVKNSILALRSKKDRLETRIITIALRHDWDVPAITDKESGKRLDIEARELEKVFGVATLLVKSELRKDVGHFTANTSLPLQKIAVK